MKRGLFEELVMAGGSIMVTKDAAIIHALNPESFKQEIIDQS